MIKELKISDIVDACNNHGIWYVATVLDITPTNVQVSLVD